MRIQPDTRARARLAMLIGAIAAAIGLAATPATAAPQAGQAAPAGTVCTLHVWGAGRPNFVMKPNALVRIKIDPAQMDRSNPLSNVNVFSTVNRVSALSDADLKKLLPQADQVVIVRHAEVIDTDKTPLKALSGPIVPGATGCYADLIIANLYAIFPNPGAAYQQAGLVGLVLVGGDRLVIDFWFRDFSSPAAGGKTYKRKNDSPLPHEPFLSAEMKAALEISTTANFLNFVDFVDKQRPH